MVRSDNCSPFFFVFSLLVFKKWVMPLGTWLLSPDWVSRETGNGLNRAFREGSKEASSRGMESFTTKSS